VLVSPDSAEELAAALAKLISDPERRRVLARAAHKHLTAGFGLEQNIAPLAAKLGLREPRKQERGRSNFSATASA